MDHVWTMCGGDHVWTMCGGEHVWTPPCGQFGALPRGGGGARPSRQPSPTPHHLCPQAFHPHAYASFPDLPYHTSGPLALCPIASWLILMITTGPEWPCPSSVLPIVSPDHAQSWLLLTHVTLAVGPPQGPGLCAVWPAVPTAARWYGAAFRRSASNARWHHASCTMPLQGIGHHTANPLRGRSCNTSGCRSATAGLYS